MDLSQSNLSSKLNPVQLHLLELFSKGMGEKELQDIQALLVEYYSKKIDEEMDEIWERRNYTPASFVEATKDLHLRARKKQ